jgi:hypothetical protein
MKTTDKRFFVRMNILLPILIGGSLYYLVSPDVIFVQQTDNFLGIGFHVADIGKDFFVMKFIRNYLLDMMWSYALIFALFALDDNNTANLLKIFPGAFSFSTIMEFLQLTPIAKGTFDVCDIAAEFLAEVIAVFIIKRLYEEDLYEKENKGISGGIMSGIVCSNGTGKWVVKLRQYKRYCNFRWRRPDRNGRHSRQFRRKDGRYD